MDKGRVVYNALGHENVYKQQNGYGSRLLWNLIEYAGGGDADEPLAKAISPGAAPGVTLEGRRVALSLGEGSHVLRISDFSGRTVLSKTFMGPGRFHTDPIAVNGSYSLTLKGPTLRVQKQVTLK